MSDQLTPRVADPAAPPPARDVRGASFGRVAEVLPVPRDLTFGDLLRILWKHRRIILATLFVFLLSASAYCLLTDKLYTATASLEIRGYAPVLKGADLESQYGADTRKQEYLKTSIAKIRRLPVADRALADEALARDVLQYLQSRGNWLSSTLSRVSRFVRDGRRGEDSVRSPEVTSSSPHYRLDDGFLEKYVGLLDVNPIRETSLVELAVTTASPRLSQRIANAHATAFVEHQRLERQRSTLENLELLQTQTNELKDRVTSSEQTIARYAEENQLVTLSDARNENDNIIIKQIGELTALLVDTASRRMKSESLLKEVSSPTAPESTILDNSAIGQLRVSLNESEAEFANLSQKLTPEYPSMVQLRAKIDTLRRMIGQERRQALNALRAQVASDRATESKVLQQIEILRLQAHDLSKRFVQYSMLNRESESLRDLYQALLRQLKETQISLASSGSNIFVTDYATVPKAPSAPLTNVVLMLGIGLGLLVGIVLALIREMLDNTMKSLEDVQAVIGFPTLGTLPSFATVEEHSRRRLLSARASSNGKGDHGNGMPAPRGSLVTISSPRAVVSESLRTIRAGILLSSADHPSRIILVTSAGKGEGKTTVACNLAVTLAQASFRTLIVDADIRQSAVVERFQVSRERPGIADYLAGQVLIGDIVTTDILPNLHVIGAGSAAPNPTELVGSRKMAQLLELLAEHYDYIVLDAPPVLPVADSLMLSRMVDGLVFVVRSNETHKDRAREASRRLQQVSARILGVVLNDVPVRSDDLYYGHVGDSVVGSGDRPQTDDRRQAEGGGCG